MKQSILENLQAYVEKKEWELKGSNDPKAMVKPLLIACGIMNKDGKIVKNLSSNK